TLRSTAAAAAGADPVSATVAGLHLAFLVAAGIGVAAVVLASTLRQTEAAGPGHGPHADPSEVDVPVADADLR
ncbi:MAG TPA: hypothetical protein VFU98_13585, partial [Microlunatus sp.]|nr:hypothetical protein [Microlunatus sp.]